MEDSLNWRQKALARRVENKELRKRIKELKASRDNWKNKYLTHKEKSDFLEFEIQKIKKKLVEIIGG